MDSCEFVGTVAEWLDFAKMDLDTAIHLDSTMHPKPLEIICYHCQQSVEKYLKALLIHFGQPVEKTHDLTFLAEILQSCIEISDETYAFCAELTKYAVRVRYPQQMQIDQKNIDSAISKANKIQLWVKQVLGAEK